MTETGDWKWHEIDAVAFDAVGTLIEPTPSVAVAYVQAAQRQGVALEPSEVKRRFHRFFRVDEIDETRGPMVTDEGMEWKRWRRIVGNVLPELPDVERAFQELWDHFGNSSAWRVFDDVPRSLSLLNEAGIPFLIASNFDGRLRSVLRGLPALASLGETAVISSLVGYRKPHPRFYESICERLAVQGSRILYIGDDLVNDFEGPILAGLRALRLERDGKHDPTRMVHTRLTDIVESRVAAISTGGVIVSGR